jgi:hypothetical protein
MDLTAGLLTKQVNRLETAEMRFLRPVVEHRVINKNEMKIRNVILLESDWNVTKGWKVREIEKSFSDVIQ